ncbi:MAG TPA: lanthionine synthetase LanC family protein [Thermoanaerobaculia bacterium]|nr:lanthionine synthetase LanC family protein [Thermoanaerobaculia bacterium]
MSERRERWIGVAEAIAGRLVGSALWQGDRCTWPVAKMDLASGETAKSAAGGDLYQGSAGIALFLGELAAVTGDETAARAAVGGIRHALVSTEAWPRAMFGFHSGHSGIAWVADRLGGLLDRPELSARALDLLAGMAGEAPRGAGVDVIGGAAGAIPVFLELAERHARPDLAAVAAQLGDHLLATARRNPDGWSWGNVGPSATRNLTGWAHGASGIATALLELATATGDGRYRFAAEMALLYERRLFDREHANWPDLRHSTMNRLYYSQGDAALAAADAAGQIEPHAPKWMRAWCYGAPGVGLARLRAWELTGEAVHRREAEVALATTVDTLDPPIADGWSLCHGIGGNLELPLHAARIFDAPDLLALCERTAEAGRIAFEAAGVPWHCGAPGGLNDPSLMLGEAGIGHVYLRLVNPRMPSVLLPRPRLARVAGSGDGHAALAGEWVDDAFGLSRAAFTALGVELAEPRPRGADADLSPLEAAYRELCRAVEAATGERAAALADAFRVERAAYERLAVPRELTAEYLRRLRRPPVAEVDWERARFTAAPELELVEVEGDWPAWLDAHRGGAAAPPPTGTGSTWLVARQGHRLTVCPVGPLAAAVLATVADSAPLGRRALGARLAAAAGAEGTAAERLAERAGEQAVALYAAGHLDLAPEPAAEAAPGGAATASRIEDSASTIRAAARRPGV